VNNNQAEYMSRPIPTAHEHTKYYVASPMNNATFGAFFLSKSNQIALQMTISINLTYSQTWGSRHARQTAAKSRIKSTTSLCCSASWPHVFRVQYRGCLGCRANSKNQRYTSHKENTEKHRKNHTNTQDPALADRRGRQTICNEIDDAPPEEVSQKGKQRTNTGQESRKSHRKTTT